ncbi:MAG: metallophosphoesterase family protein [Chloroflexota bacterium]
MRLAVLSDIHGNLIALDAVLADIQASGEVDVTWCLGDIAAFGPRPAECIRRLKALAEADEGKKFKVIGGNTDRYFVTGERPRQEPAKDAESFKKMVAEWETFDAGIHWGLEHLSFEDYEYLSKILGHELSKEVKDYGAVIGYHAIPGDDEARLTPETPAEEANDALLDREGRLGIGGHIHRQFDRDLGAWRIINVGSVGMSANNPGFAEWGLFTFDNDVLTVDFRRVPYDVDALVADFYAVGYPGTGWTARYLQPDKPKV